jgi:hypothetical protein
VTTTSIRGNNEPPDDLGERLATISRGRDEELRVRLKEYEGHPFISLEKWQRDGQGRWWPQKGSVSVRTKELTQVGVALFEADKRLRDDRRETQDEE